MRISDWSSDVCSSDQQLPIGGPAQLLVELLDLVDVDGGGEPSAVTEVVVDERARHAGGIGHLLEAHLVGVPAVEDRRGGLDEERAARHRVQPGLALALVDLSATHKTPPPSGRSAHQPDVPTLTALETPVAS